MPSPARSRRRSPLAVLALGLTLALALSSCGSTAPAPCPSPSATAPAASATATQAAGPSASTNADTSGGPLTDYALATNWMLAPATPTKPVDVFYLYPTAYNKKDASSPNVADIKSAGMRIGARSAYRRQASAFADAANIYAPYYRQLDATWALALSPAEHSQAVGGAPTEDATAAFAYYIEHFNNGRPFAIAAHSQGSDVASHLLAGWIKDHPEVAKRLVVAYVIGYSITPDYIAANPLLPFATGATDTGVIVSYNTEAPDTDGLNPVVLPGALAINPITWTTDGTPAPASASKGAWLPTLQMGWIKVPHYADATVDASKGAIISSTPDVDLWSPGGHGVFPRGVYHSFDYPFYYFDLQANFETRVAAFLAGS